MITLLVCVGVITLLFYFIGSPYTYWKNKNVPNPPVSFLFGNVGSAILQKRSIHEVYDDLYKKYQQYPYIGFYKSRTPCILLRDLNVVKEILVRNFNSFADNDIMADEVHDPLFAKNPFVSKGKLWKENRGQISSSFTAKRIKEMFPLIEAVAKGLVTYIDSKVVGDANGVEAKNLFVKYTTDVVTSCALGLDANSFTNTNSEYLKMISTIFAPNFIGKVRLFLMFNFPLVAKLLKMRFIPDVAERYYRTVVKNATEYRIKNKIQRGDFLESLNKLKNESISGHFTDDDIAGHILSFITEGTETSAIVLSFTLYELALNLEVQDKLRVEIDKTVAKCNGKITFEAISEMEYLEQVINETMRKNTVAPVIRRVCTSEFHLESPYKNGTNVTIETGTPMIISIHSIHHDPKYYPNPSSFDPTRFTSENKEKLHNYAFLPFGEGPRLCLGMRFGYTQVKTALVYLLANFEVKMNTKTTVPYQHDPQYFLLEATGGLWFDICKRK